MFFYFKIKAFGDIFKVFFLSLLIYFYEFKIFFFFKKIEERSNLSKKTSNILQLSKLLFTILVIAHLLACFWILFDDIQKKIGISYTWLTKLDLET